MKRARSRDTQTSDMFTEVPKPAAPTPGSMDYRGTVAGIVGEMLHEAARKGKDRFAVSAECSRLAGKDVTKNMLDAYTAESRDDFNAPAWLLPVIESVCGSHLYSNWLAGVRGGRLMIGRDALDAELGRIAREKAELVERERVIRETLRRPG